MHPESLCPSYSRFQTRLPLDPNMPNPFITWVLPIEIWVMGSHPLSYYQRAIQLRPQEPDYRYALGNLHSDLGDYQEAVNEYNEAINIGADFSNAFYNRGIAKHNLRDFLGAIQDFDISEPTGLIRQNFYMNRAISRSNIGQENDALGIWIRLRLWIVMMIESGKRRAKFWLNSVD
ncbi:MAG: hypothetical protein CM1200mP15_17700 [Dehalococcoidia bacterium]|nr:MAG: hypothetical protein CM1200mP15_17700 [Dehalococcoidia bacterium]